jgi:hypothetical protein
MSTKQIALDLAAFLDSSQVAAVEGVKPEEVRRIAEAYLACCYNEIGKKPHLLDGQDVHGVVGHLLPARFKHADPLAAHVPQVLRAFLGHLEESRVVTQIYEQRRALEETLPEFTETVRSGKNAHHHGHERQEPLVHKAPKLGRNDPCSCGSGKKYKKCHGKAD